MKTDNEFREFIEKTRWQYAKTMPDDPHEYTVRSWCDDQEFENAVRFIQSKGKRQRWWSMVQAYYYIESKNVGELKYWTMGSAPEETTIINRAVDGTSSYEKAIRAMNHCRPSPLVGTRSASAGPK